MRNQLVTAGIILFVLTIGLSGCIVETDKIDVPINTLGLTLDDLQGNYEILTDYYITEPYIVEEGLILEGWRVLEKYEVSFIEEEYPLSQTLAKFESKEKCKEVVDFIRLNYIDKFPELSIETVGEGSYFGQNTTAYEGNKSLYLLCFRIENIVTVLFGTSPSMDTFISYVHIIENNINEAIKDIK